MHYITTIQKTKLLTLLAVVVVNTCLPLYCLIQIGFDGPALKHDKAVNITLTAGEVKSYYVAATNKLDIEGEVYTITAHTFTNGSYNFTVIADDGEKTFHDILAHVHKHHHKHNRHAKAPSLFAFYSEQVVKQQETQIPATDFNFSDYTKSVTHLVYARVQVPPPKA